MVVGFGRTLKAVLDEITELRAPQLSIISLAGSVARDGSFNSYEVGLRLAEKPLVKSSYSRCRSSLIPPMSETNGSITV